VVVRPTRDRPPARLGSCCLPAHWTGPAACVSGRGPTESGEAPPGGPSGRPGDEFRPGGGVGMFVSSS
jgi:hypothetical protein